ncbi:AlpA family transcriptional regulator [Sulfuricurvum sp.]|jgi:prophage regulatory protein|uniref:helix-turn-helix transcriptional regulator n=1 Tax=Sulfuricurvum sp. TaxID=2025608 RepID=UPI00260E335D|nr:AlpA family phage regulatory protein [Sulfuricurvum sp.]MDD4950516.1 AlpA family phage regulatory protein [Sulfuricurvum sp.]
MSQQERLLRLKEVLYLTRISKSTIYENMKKGLFPKQVNPSPGVSAWKESEIIALMNGEWRSRS